MNFVFQLKSNNKDKKNLMNRRGLNSLFVLNEKIFFVTLLVDGTITFGTSKKKLFDFNIDEIKLIRVKKYVENNKKRYELVFEGENDVLLILNDEFYKTKDVETFFVVVMEVNKHVKIELAN